MKITSEILKLLGDNSGDTHLDHLYSFILDIIDTKIYASKATTIKERSPPKCTLYIYTSTIKLWNSSEFYKFQIILM